MAELGVRSQALTYYVIQFKFYQIQDTIHGGTLE